MRRYQRAAFSTTHSDRCTYTALASPFHGSVFEGVGDGVEDMLNCVGEGVPEVVVVADLSGEINQATGRPSGQFGWHAFKRVGADCTDPGAFRVIKVK